MEQQLLELLAAGDNVGGYLLVWILFQQHKRLVKLESAVFPAAGT